MKKTKKQYLKKNPSWGNIKIINIPNKNKKLAELVGIVLGDGNIDFHKRGKKIGTYQVRISGNSIKDYDYLTNYVNKLCQDLFHIKPGFYKSKRSNCLHLILRSRLVVDFLVEIGLKTGDKIKSQVTIPKWVFENDDYLKACLRGLIDTDGCIYEMTPHWPGLFQLNFENRNITLLRDVRRAMINLGFSPSRICGNRSKHGTKIYISRKEEIKKFYKEIGFSNQRVQIQAQKVLDS